MTEAERIKREAGLKKPVRYVRVKFGGIPLKIARGADDPTPDAVLVVGGVPVRVSKRNSSK